MNNKIKLYVWDDVLENRGYGVCFALATSQAEAIDTIVGKLIKDCTNQSRAGISDCENCLVCSLTPSDIRRELNDRTPTVTGEKYGFYLEGGDY